MRASAMPASRRPRKRALAAALCAAVVTLAVAGRVAGQAREWWDTYEQARRIVENEGASQNELSSARSLLLQVTRSQNTEGNLPTYNPSVRIDYLPFFYLGWAEMRLGRFDDAEKRFQRSGEIGFITKGAPRELRSRFEQLRGVVGALRPAAAALERARGSASVTECIGGAGIKAGPKLRDAMGGIEALIAAPRESAGLEAAARALDSAVAECVREVAGARVAKFADEYHAARDAVNLQGIQELLPGQAARQLKDAIESGDRAEAAADEKALVASTETLRKALPRLSTEVDSAIAVLVREAGQVAAGNESTLNGRAQLGTRLQAATAKARGRKAAGRSGAELAGVVGAALELKGVLEEARQVVEPLLRASRNSLEDARNSFEGWLRARGCEMDAVEASPTVRRASTDAGAALRGSSADAMGAAERNLGEVRAAVEKQIASALPRVRQQASGIAGSAESVLANVSSDSDRTRGRQLSEALERASGGGDICAIEKATADLRGWVGSVAPALEEGRRQAIARNMPLLDSVEALRGGFAAMLDSTTLSALDAPVQALTDLVKNSYDPASIDAAGAAVKRLVDTAKARVQEKMQQGVGILDALLKQPGWSGIDEDRRRWLEGNLDAVRRAVDRMESPELLARFAREYPRARAELALRGAFSALYKRNDAAAAESLLDDLGPAVADASPSIGYALSYVYWWQAREAGPGQGEALMEKARQAFRSAREQRMDPSSLGGSLFAPAFVAEMSGI